MFKVGLDLPSEVAKEATKTRKKTRNAEPLTGNDLQQMLDELKKPNGKRAKTDSETKSVQIKSDKRAKEGSKPVQIDTSAKLNIESNNEVKQSKKQQKKQYEQNEVKKPEAVPVKPANAKPDPAKPTAANSAPAKLAKKLTPLQLKMQQKLSGSRFRWINEQLYTIDSQSAFDLFQQQPQVFKEYHDGFRYQLEQWPENPVLSFATQFEERCQKPVNAPGGLPGDKSGGRLIITVADMGCGEAELAMKLQEFSTKNKKKSQFRVHSFDMHACNERITVADIAHVPLPDSSVDVVVFCLALMGTNLVDFVREAIRVLKPNGLMWIAEIKSRFEGNEYTEFVEKLKDIGLYHKTTDDTNKMFVKFEFVKLPHKLARARNEAPELTLKPCIYKRR